MVAGVRKLKVTCEANESLEKLHRGKMICMGIDISLDALEGMTCKKISIHNTNIDIPEELFKSLKLPIMEEKGISLNINTNNNSLELFIRDEASFNQIIDAMHAVTVRFNKTPPELKAMAAEICANAKRPMEKYTNKARPPKSGGSSQREL